LNEKEHRYVSQRLIERWVGFVHRHPIIVLTLAILATGAVLYYAVTNFRMNMDTTSMISDKLQFRRLQSDFRKAFPGLSDTIVVVLDADSAELALSGRQRLAERLRKETDLFKSVYEPGGESYFQKNGLLYLPVDQLEGFADTMAGAQPLLALLSQDLSLRGLFSVLEKVLVQPKEAATTDKRIDILYDRIGQAFQNVMDSRPVRLSWQEVMISGNITARLQRQFVIIRPVLRQNDLSAGEEHVGAIRRAAKDLGIDDSAGIRMRITGDIALNYENLTAVRESIGFATAASLILVAVILAIGLGGSGRLIFSSLLTLIIGLIWTTGFAVAAVGSLNMISVTFAVLFIGLGIDYSIQFSLRYRELISAGCPYADSVMTTAQGVGRSLLLSCITTAIGFYSFIPTAYAGVAELGLISGTGMFISFLANLTVLPALLTLLPMKPAKHRSESTVGPLLAFPYKHPRMIRAAAFIIGIGAASASLPMVYFDSNPLNLYNQKSESVATIRDLFRDPDALPWSISLLAGSEEEVKGIENRLRVLKEVKRVIALPDFVPEDQTEKLSIISNISLFMPSLNVDKVKHLSYEEDMRALGSFEAALKKSLLEKPEPRNGPVSRLYERVVQFGTFVRNPEKGRAGFLSLENGLLGGLPSLFRRLETSLQAAPSSESDLPSELKQQYLSREGQYRVQVFPAENITDRVALERFVRAVRAVAPNATDAPVTIYESGKAIVSSFRQATLYALIAITLFLLVEMRSIALTILILIPLILGILLTAAASVLLAIPLNFANVIVVPLLLGVGVHSGIIFVLRYQTEPPANGNMLTTSTARAILFSSLTTMISTGSLSFSSHRGIASIGILLTFCFGFLILCTLVLLPALLELHGKRRAMNTPNRQ